VTDLATLHCDDAERRALLVASGGNGIDAIEVAWEDQTRIRVYFVDAVPTVPPERVEIAGGVRLTDISVTATSEQVDDRGLPHLEVLVDQAGDYASYVLRIDLPGELDPRFAGAAFSFKAGCPSDLDCARSVPCPPEDLDEPDLDYLAKDFASFRQLQLDQLPEVAPDWVERNPSDLGVALVELFAAEGDLLSYQQDAVATESWLATARLRTSVRRHVRLVDYPMHEGQNALAFLHVTVSAPGTLPAASLACPERIVRVLSRIDVPLTPGGAVPGAVVVGADADAAVAAAEAVFEVAAPARLDPTCNEIAIHTWGDGDCCLPTGATTLDLVGAPAVQEGDLLLLEEVKGVRTGRPRDADPRHRQVVRLSGVETTEDPLLTDDDGEVVLRTAGHPPLQVTRVRWDEEDALRFPLCVSTLGADGETIGGIAVARGNIVVVDHGLAVTEARTLDDEDVRYSRVAHRFQLADAPLSHGLRRGVVPDGPAIQLEQRDPRDAVPHLLLVDGSGAGFAWTPGDLLAADPFTRTLVTEPDRDGRASVRFGDGEHGRRPPTDDELSVRYRIGQGRSGNVGRDALVHLVEPAVLPPTWPAIVEVRNPLAATGGTDPEPVSRVRSLAPDAFRAVLARAVTEADYAAAAEQLSGVSRAVATYRWTGSWLTVFVSVDPRGTDTWTPDLVDEVRTQLQRFRQAGYDLEIRPPEFVALDIGVRVCASRGHRPADVAAALLDALSDRRLSDGSQGFFHPDRFTFGQPLHLSALYAAIEQVPGVDVAEVTRFRRFGDTTDAIDLGRIDAGRLQILRLADDPSLPEHGVLEVEVREGAS
jgi:hypothetical protein